MMTTSEIVPTQPTMREIHRTVMDMICTATNHDHIMVVASIGESLGQNVTRNRIYDKAKFQSLDIVLRDIDFTAMTAIAHMICYLRYTFAYRSYLDHWRDAVLRAKMEIEDRGEDSYKILVGLISKETGLPI